MTFRELVWAANGKGKFEWAQTSNVMALMLTVNNAKGKVFDPRKLNPYEQQDAGCKDVIVKGNDKESVAMLRRAFIGMRKG